MELNEKQLDTKAKIESFSKLFNLDPNWTLAIAMAESSLGLGQLSPTGCKGAFQMSSIAMKDLLQEMGKVDSDLVDIACGLSFLYLLLKRHKTIDEATAHFCDPKDRTFYLNRVHSYMNSFNSEVSNG